MTTGVKALSLDYLMLLLLLLCYGNTSETKKQISNGRCKPGCFSYKINMLNTSYFI